MIMITSVTARMLKQFKTWLANNRHFLFSWYTKDSQETQEPERSLVELPTDLRQQLVDAIENLPSNPADKQAISSTLDEAFDRWRENPNNTDNSIVILSSPVTTVSRILSETLQEWTEQKQVSMKLLPLTARPTEIENIKTKLEHYLEKHSLKSDSETQQLEIAVIPNLSWCFLRSIEGLEGIEYLQSLLCDGSKNRFWIIGAGQVGWGYLNSVCNIEAYCGEVSILPEIESEKLQEWLDPIINKLDITFDKPRLDKQFLDGDKDNRNNYFNHLTDISQGVSTIALQGFLKSIRYEKTEEEDETKPKQNKLVAQIPRLPNLPALEPVDRYLLYSLLLHEDLTIPALAESLGDVESEVQGRVRVLRRQGVIEQRDKVLKINPIHYPKIKQELANNNFIIHK